MPAPRAPCGPLPALVAAVLAAALLLAPAAAAAGPKPGLTITSPTDLPAVRVGEQAHSVQVEVAGGTPPYLCEDAGGGRPSWFGWSAPCRLEGGAPEDALSPSTSKKTFTFQVKVTDSSSPPLSTKAKFTLPVLEQPPEVTALDPKPCHAKKECSRQVATTDDPKQNKFRLGSLLNGAPPLGLSITSGGALKGKPAKEGVYTFDVCARNPIGDETCAAVTLVVLAEGAVFDGTWKLTAKLKFANGAGGQDTFTASVAGGAIVLQGITASGTVAADGKVSGKASYLGMSCLWNGKLAIKDKTGAGTGSGKGTCKSGARTATLSWTAVKLADPL